MNKWGTAFVSALATGVLALAALAGTAVSGPQVGQHMSAFDVSDLSGPAKGQTLCYV
jgi:hypothetical protein